MKPDILWYQKSGIFREILFECESPDAKPPKINVCLHRYGIFYGIIWHEIPRKISIPTGIHTQLKSCKKTYNPETQRDTSLKRDTRPHWIKKYPQRVYHESRICQIHESVYRTWNKKKIRPDAVWNCFKQTTQFGLFRRINSRYKVCASLGCASCLIRSGHFPLWNARIAGRICCKIRILEFINWTL